MSKSGWCAAPDGARVRHHECRMAACSCECHGGENPAQQSPIRVESETSEGRNPGKETDPLATVSTRPKGA